MTEDRGVELVFGRDEVEEAFGTARALDGGQVDVGREAVEGDT